MARQIQQKITALLHNGAFLLITACLLTVSIPNFLSSRLLADTGTWVDGEHPHLDVGETVTGQVISQCSPTVFTYSSFSKPNGSSDTIPHDYPINACATENELGEFGTSIGSDHPYSYDFIKPQTSHAFRVLDTAGRITGFLPVPNQKIFLYRKANPTSRGSSMYLFNNLAAYGSFGQHYVYNTSQTEMTYQLTSLPEPLKDSTGHPITTYNGLAFSQNGQWMAAETNAGILRINTQTQAMQLFSTQTMSYDMGYEPKMELAISDDGNYVIKSGRNASGTFTYDLTGCQPGSFIIGTNNTAATQGCRSRLVNTNIEQQFSGFNFLSQMRFSADGKQVNGTVIRYASGGNPETMYRMTYSIAGYQPPHLAYLALGDSFSSGEGAYNYEPGTDSYNPKNLCHLSNMSYPYLTARALDISDFHSVACSGAKTTSYYNQRQYDNSGSFMWLSGEDSQNQFVLHSKPDSITMSMGGNDIGFSDKLQTCIAGTDDCYQYLEDREEIANEIYDRFDDLTHLYKQIRSDSGNSKIYVLGYPQIFGIGNQCGLNVKLDANERKLARGITTYLNAVIKAATENAGVQYINVEDAFTDHELCDSGTKAVNGLTRGNDAPIPNKGPLGNESFHPNILGHELMSQALISQSQSLTKPMPLPDPSKRAAPFTGSDAYEAVIGNAPASTGINHIKQFFADGPDFTLKDVPIAIKTGLKGQEMSLHSEAPVQIWLHSEPTYLGSITTDINGNLDGEVTIPADTPPGYHTLDIIGKNIAGEDIDLYKTIYVAASETDYDGDGIPNDQEKCLFGDPVNVDEDHDGIDDACDGEIAIPDTTPPTVTGTPDRNPNSNGWYNNNVTINWNVVDPEPSSGAPTQPGATTASEEGEHTYNSTQSCDPTGNCAAGSVALKIDKTAPELGTPNWTNNPKPSTQDTILTVPLSDNTSGIESAEYFIGDEDPGFNNAKPMEVSDNQATTTFGSDLEPGTYEIHVRAQDKAGNWSLEKTESLTVYNSTNTTQNHTQKKLSILENIFQHALKNKGHHLNNLLYILFKQLINHKQ